MDSPHPLGKSLVELLEEVTFSDPDPRIQNLKERWAEWQRLEQEAFERVCKERYDYALNFHQICRTPNPEDVAREEVRLCRPMWEEELNARLTQLWQEITRRVNAVLEDIKDESTEDAPRDERQGEQEE